MRDGEIVKITLLEALTQYTSPLGLASMIDSSQSYPDWRDNMLLGPELQVAPDRIFEELGDGLSNVGLQYLLERDALEFVRERQLPELHWPRFPLRVGLVHGTSDEITPWQNTDSLAHFFRRSNAEVRFEKVPGASHAWDVPIVEAETGRKDDFDWKGFLWWQAEPMGWDTPREGAASSIPADGADGTPPS